MKMVDSTFSIANTEEGLNLAYFLQASVYINETVGLTLRVSQFGSVSWERNRIL